MNQTGGRDDEWLECANQSRLVTPPFPHDDTHPYFIRRNRSSDRKATTFPETFIYNPGVSKSSSDASNFDEDFTNEKAALTPVHDKSLLASIDPEAFLNFSYTNPQFLS
ncbi:hypothetical protein Y032_0321g2414 [Ancylostoma ceylanicum]|uniref:AGC-kinase C-terminal domain-containing protein n=1 Tax=Ancylostoma ceylanicum TaxID=53326 RepID=A0A016S1R6_9BILA|nr:hypothetical protein Y032_0321g2414 [Ancylostoma ceylanicum]